MSKKVILFDIDGTLANGDHREHLYKGRDHTSWPEFIAASIHDEPHVEIQWLNHIIAKQEDVYIIVLTARSESGRALTEQWLAKHDIVYHEIILKPEVEAIAMVKDYIFKERVLNDLIAQGLTPFMVFEDRQNVVDMWRNRGIKCLQVQPGDF